MASPSHSARLRSMLTLRPEREQLPRARPPTWVTLLAVSLLVAIGWARAAAARPRLAVVVIFDQLRTVELERYAPFFGEGGFGGLGGARYDAVYSYAGTETGPGHATMSTGANPEVHGIASNHWYVGKARQYAVDDPRSPVIGATDGSGRGPLMLVAPTLGDVMKAESAGRAKVVAISLKDRGAILSVGPSADLALWYDPQLGRFTTSRAYASSLPTWVEELGASLPAATMAKGAWSSLPVPAGLEHLVPDDNRAGEGAAQGLGPTFPHDFASQPESVRRKLYRSRPESVDDLFALALRALDEMGLGRDHEADLLVVSVSTTDFVGHNFGPDSLEELDLLRRADSSLRRFRAALEARVPRREMIIALSSDHGAPPLPAAAEGKPWPGGIVPAAAVVQVATAAADRALARGKPRRPEAPSRVLGFQAPQLFLDEEGLTSEETARLRKAVAGAVGAMPGIARVYDLDEPGPTDPWEPILRASRFPGRAGQLFVRQAPRVVFLDNDEKLGTDHGTPYLYDRRVPFIVAGPGVRPGRYATPVDPRDLAPTIAFLLGVPPPDMAQGKPVHAVGD